MSHERILVDNLTIRFQMSYEQSTTLRDWIVRRARRWMQKKKTEHFTALQDVSMTIREGEIVGVIGPNGCGKTTLLRAVSGIYHPDAGVVTTHGRVSTLLSLGTGFDNNLNGLENIRLSGLIHGLTHKEIDECTPRIVQFADIGEHIHMPMTYYSNGMISRLSFAIVLIMQPDVLLIDEVFSVGDLEFQRKSASALHELMSQASCQLIVTHNLSFVREHCNRAIYIRGGRIIEDGEPDAVVSRYEKESA